MPIKKPQVVASECCAGLYPQNTLSGFQYCLDSGVDGIEFDVHLSHDKQVVVQHDARLNRDITRNAQGRWLSELSSERPSPLSDLSLNQIKQYDVGRYAPESRPAKDYPNYSPIDGAKIPTLDEFLKLYIANNSQATLWIELKSTPFDRESTSDPGELLSEVLALVTHYKVEPKTVLLAFEWQVLVQAMNACPGIGTDFLSINPEFIKRLYRNKRDVNPTDMYAPLNPTLHGESLPRTIHAASGNWWGPWVGDVTSHDVSTAQACGVKVNVWGVQSNEAAIEDALTLGADALTISDSSLLQVKVEGL